MMKRNNAGRNFIGLMLTIAIVSLFLRVIIKQTIKANISQNEGNASILLKTVAAGLENYAKDNSGLFPTNINALIQASPRYLDKNYIANSPVKGYALACVKLDSTGYECSASPLKCNITGTIVYSISTGGVLVSESCNKKEEVVLK